MPADSQPKRRETARPRRHRKPRQARARATVDAIVEGAARVFRREGWDATTNRIAVEAGVGIGSLYEYFPDKQALLVALAERHVDEAEALVGPLLSSAAPTAAWLAELQSALIACQRYPSHALTLVREVERVGEALRARAERLEQVLIASLLARARAAGLDEPELRARACFEVLGPLSVRALFEHPDTCQGLVRHYLAMARTCLV